MADFNDVKVTGNLRLTQEPYFMPGLAIENGGTGMRCDHMSPYALLKVTKYSNYESYWSPIMYNSSTGVHSLKVANTTYADTVVGADAMKHLDANYAVPVTCTGAIQTSAMKVAGFRSQGSSDSLVCALDADTVTVGNTNSWNGWRIIYDGSYSEDTNTFCIV